MTVLLTGASGFVGRVVCPHLAASLPVVVAVRRDMALPPDVEARRVGELSADTDWSAALAGVERIVHMAARAHVMRDTETDPLEVFRRVNRDGTLRLAEQAAAQGVRRFVFVSTIKVNGEASPPDRPFAATDTPRPVDPYGIAKAEAEEKLLDLADRTGMEVVIVRPPLIHGPGAKGNLATLMRVVAHGLPLPLGGIDNRRSLLGVHNLAELLHLCLTHPDAAGQILLARDDDDVSTPDLIRRLAASMGRSIWLPPVPATWLGALAKLAGKSAAFERLAGWLQVDDSPTRRTVGWRPSRSLDQGLALMVGGDKP